VHKALSAVSDSSVSITFDEFLADNNGVSILSQSYDGYQDRSCPSGSNLSFQSKSLPSLFMPQLSSLIPPFLSSQLPRIAFADGL
jgi:hypothetical protein